MRHAILDPLGFRHVVEIDDKTGEVYGFENVAHHVSDQPRGIRAAMMNHVVDALRSGGVLPPGYQREEKVQ